MVALKRMNRPAAIVFPAAPSAWNGFAPLPPLSSRVMTTSMLKLPTLLDPLVHRWNAAYTWPSACTAIRIGGPSCGFAAPFSILCGPKPAGAAAVAAFSDRSTVAVFGTVLKLLLPT